MYLRNFDLLSGEKIDPPEIIWGKDERYAIIAFLLLSVDGRMSEENLKKFAAFMYSILAKAKNNAGGEVDENKLPAVMDAIIREGCAFLDSLDQDESFCDYVMDEIDRIIEGNEKCGIGNGYVSWGKSVAHKDLPGAAYVLFDYVKLLDSDNGQSINQKRLLKHLAKKWDVDRSVLAILEDSSKTLGEISKRRHEIENSGMPEHEAVSALSGLDAEEKAVWKNLNTLNIAKDRATSAYVTYTNAIADILEGLGGDSYRVRIRGEDEDEEYEEEEEESLSDRIGDRIVEGIHKVGDIICAPFEWMTGKLIEWM